MEPKTSTSDARVVRAFYLPATAAGRRLERAASSILRDRSQLVRGSATVGPARAFYLPAMAVTSAVPGRVERFVTAHLRDHGVRTRAAAVADRVREFYLPATLRW